VLLTRGAGEDRERSATAAPAVGQGDQARAEHVAGEVLLADADLGALPASSDLPHRREHDVGEQRVE
jgi:hypothetical protein